MDSDDRFKHLASDPRFKRLRKQPIQIDERFQAIHTDEKFIDESKDKRGWYSSDASSSSDESESDDDEVEINELQYDWQPLDQDAEKTDNATRRLAIQNLDWDHLDVKDIFVLINSIRLPLSVKIYVSEFGKVRLAKEEKEGPEELADVAEVDEDEEEYKKLEAKMKQLDDQDKLTGKKYKANEYEDADEVIDSKNEQIRERIRRYQLSKMKYYYAITEFDSVESAEAVYKELDGLEYEGSSLELDLRFVPDEMEFNDEDMKAECNKVPDLTTYKAPQFINSALQQTTVKFTWDDTDTKRDEKLRRAYTKDELEKDDLEAYLASDSESEDEDCDQDVTGNDGLSVITGNSEARISKYKTLLKTLEDEEANKKKVDVDVIWGDYDKDEATAANEVNEDELSEHNLDDDDDDSEQGDSDIEDEEEEYDDDEEEEEEEEEQEEEEIAASKLKRDKRKNKRLGKKKTKNLADDERQNEDLDLLLLNVGERSTGEFKFNPDDDRFKAVYESGLYNIDPSHPNFKRTNAFEQIAEKKRSKRQKR